MFLNVRAPPFDDLRVRRALNYAVDRGRVAELLGSARDAQADVPAAAAGLHGYAPTCPFTVNPNPAGSWIGPDLAKARRLVAASGTRGMKVEFWGVSDYGAGRPLLPLAAARPRLSRHRAHVRRSRPDRRERRRRAAARRSSGSGSGSASSAAPYSFLQALVSCAGEVNLSRFCDPEIDARMEQAARARGPEAIELWRRVETSLADQAPTVPLVNGNNTSLTAERVGNYQHHPLWGPLLDQLWVR